MNSNLIQHFRESVSAKESLLKQKKAISKAKQKICESIIKKKKIFFCGNGGSASDAQHFVAELLVRLRPKINRKSIAAICLHMDASTLTACSNDYSYNEVFSRPLSSLGQKGDILIAISTSGNSRNIIKALNTARQMKIFSIGFLGKKGGNAKNYCDLPIIINSNNTARIQEAHIFLGHHILEEVENYLVRKKIV